MTTFDGTLTDKRYSSNPNANASKITKNRVYLINFIELYQVAGR